MPRYWVIAPIESEPSDRFDSVWQFDLTNNLISIGWANLGDVSTMNKQELADAVAANYGDRPPHTQSLITNMIWNFYHEITTGDFIIARRGRKTLAGIGTVCRAALDSPQRIPGINHRSILGVSWRPTPRDRVFSSIVFPMHALMELSEEKVQELLKETPTPVQSQIQEQIEDPQSFVLEKYLEDFIVGNFNSIFGARLEIYRDSEGNNGQQYDTEVGRIDILAIERQSGSLVVIELKKGRSSDEVIGQTLRYMGWVKKNLCREGQAVKGLVICKDPDPRLSYALEMTRDVELQYYAVSFRLKPH